MFDVATFLNEIGLPADDQTGVLALFGKHPDVAAKIEARLNAVPASVTTLQNELAAKKAQLDTEWETLASIRAGDSEAIGKAEQRIEKLASANAVLEARLRKTAGDAGIDPEPLLKDLTAPVVVPEKKVDSTMTFDRTAMLQETGAQAWTALTNAALLQDIAAEHQALFGKPLTNSAALLVELRTEVKKTGDPSITLKQVWEKTHNVEAKRKEILTADIEKQKTEAYERGKREATDAAALRTAPIYLGEEGRPRSQIFEALAANKETPVQIQGVNPTVLASIADYRKRMSEQKAKTA